MNQVEVVAGIKVNALKTQLGDIPLVPDPFLSAAITPAAGTAYGFSAVPAGIKGYYAVIVTEKDIEMPVNVLTPSGTEASNITTINSQITALS